MRVERDGAIVIVNFGLNWPEVELRLPVDEAEELAKKLLQATYRGDNDG